MKTNRFFESVVRLIRSRSLGHWLTSFLAVLLIYSLTVRIQYRDIFSPGWDFIGSAWGQYTFSTLPFFEAINELFHRVRHFQYWNSSNSAIYVLFPALLAKVYPWPYWAHLLNFLAASASFFLIGRTVHLDRKNLWILLLAALASSSILSYSIAGYPYITGFLPHILSLGLISSKRFRDYPWLQLLGNLLILEFSWHVYELGKTFLVILYAGALFISGTKRIIRTIWFLIATLQVYLILKYAHANVGRYTALDSSIWELLPRAFDAVVEFFAHPDAITSVIIFVVGLISLVLNRRNQLFWVVLTIFQIALVLRLSSLGVANLRFRRLLVLEFYSILHFTRFFVDFNAARNWRKYACWFLVCVMSMGVFFQLRQLQLFTSSPVEQQRSPLPNTWSRADYATRSEPVLIAHRIMKEIEDGRKVILLYDEEGCGFENNTDMAGLASRLYLYLGHQEFLSQILLRRDTTCVYACVPNLERVEFQSALQRIQGEASLRDYVVYMRSDFDTLIRHRYKRCYESIINGFEDLRERFLVSNISLVSQNFSRFQLKPIETTNHDPGVIVKKNAPSFKKSTMLGESLSSSPSAWGGDQIHVHQSGRYQILVGVRGKVLVELDDEILKTEQTVNAFSFHPFTVQLRQGVHKFRIESDSPVLIYIDSIELDEKEHVHFEWKNVEIEKLIVDELKITLFNSQRPDQATESMERSAKFIEGNLDLNWGRDKPWPSFSAMINGRLEINNGGFYCFDLGSDDGSQLYLDEELLIDNSGLHAYQVRTNCVYLNPRQYGIYIEFFESFGKARLSLSARYLLNKGDR